MKLGRSVLSLMLVLLLLSLTGCYDSSWAFDFKGATPADLDYFDQLPLYFALDLFDINPGLAGLVLDNVAMFGPFGFQGDLKLTLKFDLSVSSEFTANVAATLSSSASFSPDNEIKVELIDLGEGDSAEFKVFDDGDASGSYSSRAVPTSKPRVNHSGGNILEIVKAGDNYKVKLNGSTIADFTAANCSSEQPLFPGFGAYLLGGQVTFTSIRVDYNK